MEASSFIIEFHPHLAEKSWRNFMLAVGTAGATSNWLSPNKVELTCFKRSQLQHVGYIVFKVGVPDLCKLVGVSGEATIQASAYANPA